MLPDRYPEEKLDDETDNGTMPENLEEFRKAVVGQKIVNVEKDVPLPEENRGYGRSNGTRITLSSGRQVFLANTDDCCAYTMLESFFLNYENIDHMIMGVGTTDEYTKWHVFADAGDILELTVGWTPGNPFYYGYGFDITVDDSAVAPSKNKPVRMPRPTRGRAS